MRWLIQVFELVAFNLRTLPARKGSAISAIIGIAGVVAVLIGVLSIGEGFRYAMTSSGSPDVAIILRGGADSELSSILMRDDVRVIMDTPGIARKDGTALASPELFVVIALPIRKTGTDANVPFRGVTPTAFAVRPEVHVVRGRMFEWGRNELIVGAGAQSRFEGLEIGNKLTIGQAPWTVVGVFEEDGGLSESELWADATVLGPAYGRGSSWATVLAKLASPGSFQELKDSLTSDPRLSAKVVRESDYYAGQSRVLTLIVKVVGNIIAALMAIGAIFGALNTMYSAVASRTREIATLKALGFQRLPIVISVIVESMVLALAGGAIGGLLAMVLFNGLQTSTINWQTFSQVTFAFRITPALVIQGVIYAFVIGVIGGLLPAIRAARMPVSAALREA